MPGTGLENQDGLQECLSDPRRPRKTGLFSNSLCDHPLQPLHLHVAPCPTFTAATLFHSFSMPQIVLSHSPAKLHGIRDENARLVSHLTLKPLASASAFQADIATHDRVGPGAH